MDERAGIEGFPFSLDEMKDLRDARVDLTPVHTNTCLETFPRRPAVSFIDRARRFGSSIHRTLNSARQRPFHPAAAEVDTVDRTTHEVCKA